MLSVALLLVEVPSGAFLETFPTQACSIVLSQSPACLSSPLVSAFDVFTTWKCVPLPLSVPGAAKLPAGCSCTFCSIALL